jgi:hypothetical protein
MYRQIITFLFLILALKSVAQNSKTSFRLIRENKTELVKDDNLIELYYSTDNKPANKKVTGIFRSLTSDSITLDMIKVRDNKKITTGLAEPGRLYRFPINGLQSVVTVRRKLENSMKAVFFTSLAGAFIVSPLASIEHKKLNWMKVRTISGICAIPAALSITISLTCWPKRHHIKPNSKTKKLWKIEI